MPITHYLSHEKRPASFLVGRFSWLASSYFFWVFMVLPEGLSFTSSSFAFSFFLVSGSVWVGVLTVPAMRDKG